MSGPFPDDPSLLAAAARARHEWRVEQEEAARDAYVVWRHTRSLDDVLRESMARGDRVEVRVHGHAWVGVIVDLAPDLVSLREQPGRPRVDIRRSAAVPLVVRVVEPAVTAGRAGGGEDGDFRGRLRAREDAGDPCRVHLVGEADPRVARVAPGDGMVVLVDAGGRESSCALAAVIAITSAPPG